MVEPRNRSVTVSLGIGWSCDGREATRLPTRLRPPPSLAGGDGECLRVNGDCLGGVLSLVDTHQPVGQLKHVVAQRDDDELPREVR